MRGTRRLITIVCTCLAAMGVLSVLAAIAFGVGFLPPKSAQAAPLPPIAGHQWQQSADLVRTPVATSMKAARLAEAQPLAASTLTASPSKVPTPVAKPAAHRPEPPRVAVRRAVQVSRRLIASRIKAGSGWRSARASWYGPGFYGHTMAGGGTLRTDSMVVAHKSLPFGTRVEFRYRGRTVVAVVQDRGPYVAGRTFDLGPGTARALRFDGVHTVEYRILGR